MGLYDLNILERKIFEDLPKISTPVKKIESKKKLFFDELIVNEKTEMTSLDEKVFKLKDRQKLLRKRKHKLSLQDSFSTELIKKKHPEKLKIERGRSLPGAFFRTKENEHCLTEIGFVFFFMF